jgi:hypothetical protein
MQTGATFEESPKLLLDTTLVMQYITTVRSHVILTIHSENGVKHHLATIFSGSSLDWDSQHASCGSLIVLTLSLRALGSTCVQWLQHFDHHASCSGPVKLALDLVHRAMLDQ